MRKAVFMFMFGVSLMSGVKVDAKPVKPVMTYSVKKAHKKYTTTLKFKNHTYRYKTSYKPAVKVVNIKKLTRKMIVNRIKSRTIIVELTNGKVIDNKGNGKIFGLKKYNYISYRGVAGAKKGKKVDTYCIYNPNTTWEDDIVDRYDIVK